MEQPETHFPDADAGPLLHPGLAPAGDSLADRTWELDAKEGRIVQELKDNSPEPLAEPLIEVPEDLKQNLMVTSVDALVNWSRKSALWPVTFGLACCAFEMIASSMGRFDIARYNHVKIHGKFCKISLRLAAFKGLQRFTVHVPC